MYIGMNVLRGLLQAPTVVRLLYEDGTLSDCYCFLKEKKARSIQGTLSIVDWKKSSVLNSLS